MLRRVGAFFERFPRPWLAALAAAGGVWFVASFPVGALGPAVHPGFGLLGVILHGLGLAALLASGVIFAFLWWRSYLTDRLFG